MRDPSETTVLFPAYFGEVVNQLILERNADPGLLRSQVGLSLEELQQHDSLLSLAQFKALMMLGLQHTIDSEPRVLQFLKHLPMTAYGLVGVAAMTAETLEKALEVTLHYFPLLMPALELYEQRQGNEVHVHIRQQIDLGSELNAFITELTVVSIGRMAHYVSASPLKQGAFAMQVHFTHAANHEADALSAHLGHPVGFGSHENKFVISRATLSLPLMTCNRTTQQIIEAILDRQLQNTPQPWQYSQRVRRLLVQALMRGKRQSIEEAAESLAMSVRTLRRRLKQEGVTFIVLAETVRMERAKATLTDLSIPLAKLSAQLGYSDISAFSRAFKRTFGVPPGEARRLCGTA